jgi:hypothetical protein
MDRVRVRGQALGPAHRPRGQQERTDMPPCATISPGRRGNRGRRLMKRAAGGGRREGRRGGHERSCRGAAVRGGGAPEVEKKRRYCTALPHARALANALSRASAAAIHACRAPRRPAGRGNGRRFLIFVSKYGQCEHGSRNGCDNQRC